MDSVLTRQKQNSGKRSVRNLLYNWSHFHRIVDVILVVDLNLGFILRLHKAYNFSTCTIFCQSWESCSQEEPQNFRQSGRQTGGHVSSRQAAGSWPSIWVDQRMNSTKLCKVSDCWYRSKVNIKICHQNMSSKLNIKICFDGQFCLFEIKFENFVIIALWLINHAVNVICFIIIYFVTN